MVADQVREKPVCLATETSLNLETMDRFSKCMCKIMNNKGAELAYPCFDALRPYCISVKQFYPDEVRIQCKCIQTFLKITHYGNFLENCQFLPFHWYREAPWPSGRASDSGARGRGFDPHSGRRVVSLSRHLPPKKYW